MREYIKKFSTLESANNYAINDIPFTSTVVAGGGGVDINLVCNEEGKKIDVSGDTVVIVDACPRWTILHLNDGSTVELTGGTITSGMTIAYKDILVSVETGEYVTGISVDAFQGFKSLSSITINKHVIIDRGCFQDAGLQSLTIKNGITFNGYACFKKCYSLSSVTINGEISFSNPNSTGQEFDLCVVLPIINDIRYADTYLVEATDKTLATYTIKQGTKCIGDPGFSGCTNLTDIIIPDSVTSIGNSAFQGCTSLSAITIPDSVTTIGFAVFSKCTGLTSITIPSSVTSIASNAFLNCTKVRFTKVYKTYTNSLFGNKGSVIFDISSIPSGYNVTSMFTKGDDKNTATYNVYTDLEECKNQVVAFANAYTIINVYHIDGRAW